MMNKNHKQLSSTRKLAAIMFTDIQGYTSMMQENEQYAVRIRDHHREIFNSTTAQFNGKILQYFGDGTLSIFDSAIEAVNCAIEMQLSFREDPTIPVRIGIHLGDIIITEDDVIGDGVNVASRIESVAMSGSIFISGKVYEEIKNHRSIQTLKIGKSAFKNVSELIDLYAITNKGLVIPEKDYLNKKINYSERKSSPESKSILKKYFIIFLMIVLLVLIGFFFLTEFNFWGRNNMIKQSNSIAVMPFINLSGDPSYEYFSDGISEEILNSLAKIPGLSIAGRTSSFSFKNTHKDIVQIGDQLNVNMILEGSIRKSGNMIRITAQLINASNGYHLWSETYDREFKDIFIIQEDISRKIAKKLNLTISDDPNWQFNYYPFKDMEVYDLVLKGRHMLQQRIEGLEEARKCFEKVVALDPEYTPAYVDLAVTYYWMGIYYFLPPKEAFPLSITYSKKALEIDPDIALAHNFLAWVELYYLWDWEAALREYEKEKIKLSNNETYFYSHYQAYILGNFEEAIKNAENLLEKDPYSVRLQTNLADLYIQNRNYNEARIILEGLIEQNPDYSEGHRYLGLTYFYEGKWQLALEYFKEAESLSAGKGTAQYYVLCTKAALGDIEGTREEFNHLLNTTPRWLAPGSKSLVYVYLNNLDSAIIWLNNAYEERDYSLVSLKVSPSWDMLRDDPRFFDLLIRMNLTD